MAKRDQVIAGAGGAFIRCSWSTSLVSRLDSTEKTAIQLIDLHFTLETGSISRVHQGVVSGHGDKLDIHDNGTEPLNVKALASQAAVDFIQNCDKACEKSGTAFARLVIPLRQGTIARSDIFCVRIKDAFWASRAFSFSSPLQTFPGAVLDLKSASLADLIHASTGGVIFKTVAIQQDHAIPGRLKLRQEVEIDFDNKMSFSWILSKPLSRKRLVLVGSSNQDPAGGGWTQFACKAASALGIDLVIVDQADSWLERSEYASWYEAFLPATGAWWTKPPGDDMPKHMIGLLRSYGKKIDGIITFIESFHVAVSGVAKALGLKYQPTQAYEIATNKHRLGRSLVRSSFSARTTKEALEIISRERLIYPLIFKPCFGLNSEGVVRVDDAAAIPRAVETVGGTFYKEFLIEKYCDGPEVDINMVLLDGEVLFCEVCDDFPKGGDTNNLGVISLQASFHETNMVFPSALPPSELEMLQNAVRDIILRLGFTTGVMHVEARIEGSSMKYERSSASGVVDLRLAQTTSEARPALPWIIEINPRPPGLIASPSIESAYGVDYWATSLLLAIDDKDRARTLCQPFLGGAQHHGVLVLIPADYDKDACEGVFDSDDVCEEFLTRHPDLAENNIGRYGCLVKRGQKVPHPSSGKYTFLAYFNVLSTLSRKDALEKADVVRREIQYSFR